MITINGNNAVSRTAGLLAIAVFGVVILHGFSNRLGARLNELGIDEQLKRSVYEQRVKLAGLQVPETSDAGAQAQIKQAVADSFVFGFRLIMWISAALALASALSSWLMIGKSRPLRNRKR
jgi:hypothetical protein